MCIIGSPEEIKKNQLKAIEEMLKLQKLYEEKKITKEEYEERKHKKFFLFTPNILIA